MAAGKRGLFVVFEGGEGAGKTTQVQLAARALRDRGERVLTTREPGGTTAAEEIRRLLLAPAEEVMSDRCEALLFAAARADHVAKVIQPALDEGTIVLCDRFVDSSLAYQGSARGLSVDEVAHISRWATGNLVPDVTVLLDVPPEAGLARAVAGNRMESQSMQFHAAVRDALLELAGREPERYLVLDATHSVEYIGETVLGRLTACRATVAGQNP